MVYRCLIITMQRRVRLDSGKIAPRVPGESCSENFLRLLVSDFELKMDIRRDGITDPVVIDLLEEHLRCMALASPPKSIHALNLDGLRKPDVTFWTIWNGNELARMRRAQGVGFGTRRDQIDAHGLRYQRKGVARLMLQHLVHEARNTRLSPVEPGDWGRWSISSRRADSTPGLVSSFVQPFGSYTEDPNSMFMTLEL